MLDCIPGYNSPGCCIMPSAVCKADSVWMCDTISWNMGHALLYPARDVCRSSCGGSNVWKPDCGNMVKACGTGFIYNVSSNDTKTVWPQFSYSTLAYSCRDMSFFIPEQFQKMRIWILSEAWSRISLYHPSRFILEENFLQFRINAALTGIRDYCRETEVCGRGFRRYAKQS